MDGDPGPRLVARCAEEIQHVLTRVWIRCELEDGHPGQHEGSTPPDADGWASMSTWGPVATITTVRVRE